MSERHPNKEIERALGYAKGAGVDRHQEHRRICPRLGCHEVLRRLRAGLDLLDAEVA